MLQGAHPITPEAVLRRLEWRVLRRLDGRIQGDYRTLLHGSGIDVAGTREYEPGDDVRHIEWNLTARMDTPWVGTYHEDRELTAWLLLDRSGSMTFGPIERPKGAVLIELATSLARLLSRGGNLVGAILYNNSVERTIPPRTGRNHVLHLTRELLRTGRTDRHEHRPRGPRRRRLADDQAPIAGDRALGLHQRARLGTTTIAARPAPRGRRDSPVRSARTGSPRCGLDRGRGRRDRRVALGRHERSGIPSSLFRVLARARRGNPGHGEASPCRSLSGLDEDDLVNALVRIVELRRRRRLH